MDRDAYLQKIISKLGNRRLIFVGTRGSDGESLKRFPQFSNVFSQIAPIKPPNPAVEVCLESITHERVDLDSFDIDTCSIPEMNDYLSILRSCMSAPSVVLPYRMTNMLTNMNLLTKDTSEVLGISYDHQFLFNNKPWVEMSLKKVGIKTIDWEYVTGSDLIKKYRTIKTPLVVRPCKGSGGFGIFLINDTDDLCKIPPNQTVYSVSQYLNHVPLNVGACICRCGTVRCYSPSIQLIGVPFATNRLFGYCGNDFSVLEVFSKPLISKLESLVTFVGEWMFEYGYVGGFGIDVMVVDGDLVFSEINPRFQGSTSISVKLDESVGLDDIYMCHMGTFLGVPPPKYCSIVDRCSQYNPTAHIVVHNCGKADYLKRTSPIGNNIRLVPSNDVKLSENSIKYQVVTDKNITHDGKTIDPSIEQFLL